MTLSKRTLIKEGIQNFKYELAFIKHKLDLVENLISDIEEIVYSDQSSDYEDNGLDFRVKLLMEEYNKLHKLIAPEKVSFTPEEKYKEMV